MSTKYSHIQTSSTEQTFAIHRAGKFKDEKIVLDKSDAALLFADLWKFLKLKNECHMLYERSELKQILMKMCHDTATYLEDHDSDKMEFNVDYWMDEKSLRRDNLHKITTVSN